MESWRLGFFDTTMGVCATQGAWSSRRCLFWIGLVRQASLGLGLGHVRYTMFIIIIIIIYRRPAWHTHTDISQIINTRVLNTNGSRYINFSPLDLCAL